MGWATAISPEHDAAIKAAILAGRNTGNIALEFGVHRNSVVLRRRLISAAPLMCACGRPSTHVGTCRPRLAIAAVPVTKKHFTRIRSWRPWTSTHYVSTPHDFINRQLSPVEIMRAAESVIPRTLPKQVRDEVRSEILLAHLEGGLPIGEFGVMCRDFVTKVYKMFPDKYGPISLDAVSDGFESDMYARIDAANYEH